MPHSADNALIGATAAKLLSGTTDPFAGTTVMFARNRDMTKNMVFVRQMRSVFEMKRSVDIVD